MWLRPFVRSGARRATRGLASEGVPPTNGAADNAASAATFAGASAGKPPLVTGAKMRREDGRSFEKQQSPWLIRAAYIFLAGSAGAVTYELGKEQSVVDSFLQLAERGTDMKPGDSTLGASWYRLKTRTSGLMTFFSEPISVKLLPDVLPAPYQKPYTLVVDLDETLVHSEWTREHGWVTRRRPGVDYFLAYLSNFYEIVVFSQQTPFYAQPILTKLDPQGYIMYRLYRESTRNEDGVLIKDISLLNRELGRVIVIEDDPSVVGKHRDNLIVAKKWTGDEYDTWLTNLIPFLETLARTGTPDVRPILSNYKDVDVVEAFAENQRRYAAQRSAMENQQRATPSRRSNLGAMFGAEKPDVDLVSVQAKRQQEFQEQHQREMAAAAAAAEAKAAAEKAQSSSESSWFGGWFGGNSAKPSDTPAASAS